ncbi:IclR family transcriptional regulator (plasmid) [Paenibacillus rhizovicinus]|uniref:Glycerol operon regulatory protein n=1 Tax=Paenibacillus rhizovicinus TaxID=2704463 RepID=A0A6C0PCE0_9BACL|nr:IclR family transcriptional regulator [Paenibacillus rhizovicinus]QHW35523.1 IclR family transcriptional regulator [Paenibacillus rhizovicinus]
MDNKSSNRYAVPALEKSLSILESLAQSREPLSMPEIAARIKVPKTSIFMILSTLEEHGYIEKTTEGKFRLTLKLYDLGQTVLDKLDIRDIARPVMQELADQLEYTVHLASLIDGKAVYIEKVQGPSFVQFSTHIGQAWHLHNSGVGKAIAAFLPPQELDHILMKHGLPATTPNTMVNANEFKDFLESVRSLGYAIEDEEGEQGIRCIAAPVFDHNGRVVGSVSITSVRVNLPSQKFSEVGKLVQNKALLISSKLGYKTNQTNQSLAAE